MGKQLTIKLEDILESPVALRTVDEESTIFQEIVDSVKDKGILNPPNVRKSTDEKGKYVLIDGLHRYTAAKRAGLTEIPAHVLEMDDNQAQEAQLIANYHKVDTKPVEFARQLKKILAANPLMTLSELAAKINTSPNWVSERLNLLKLNGDIQSLIDEGKIGLTNGYVMTKLPEKEQVDFLDRAMTQNPQEFAAAVQSRVKEINQARKEGRDVNKEVFEPHPRARKVSEIKEALDSDTPGLDKATLQWTICLDDESVKEAEAKYQARKDNLEKAKARKKLERDEKKAAEAAEKAAKAAEELEKAKAAAGGEVSAKAEGEQAPV